MGTRVSDRRRPVRLIVTVVAAVSLTAASAATLGGINPADLFASSKNDTVPRHGALPGAARRNRQGKSRDSPCCWG